MTTSTVLLDRLSGLKKPFGRKSEDTEGLERAKRTQARHDFKSRLLLQVVKANNTQIQGHTCAGQTMNISLSGLKLLCQSEIPVGSIIDIWCDNQDSKGNYFLSGQVIWTQPSKAVEGDFNSGIKLLDLQGTNLKSWQDHVRSHAQIHTIKDDD